MKLVGSGEQGVRHTMYSVSGTTASGGSKSLVLPEQHSRSHFLFQNLSTATMYLEIGAGEAIAVVSGGAITTISVVNGGFGYTIVPEVRLYGGGNENGNTTFVGCTSPGYQGPGSTTGPAGHVGRAHAVISGGVITSIVVDDPGAGYVRAPWVLIENSNNDPNGAADPSVNSGTGIKLPAGGSYYVNGTSCPTAPLAVYCATSGSTWCCKFMT